jgi:hypothetical protein
MCGSEGSWVEQGWKPFADLGHDLIGAAHAAEVDADSPLHRDAEEPSVLPGIPLS